MDMNVTVPPPADTAVPRFTTELEFVTALANPLYLQYLGTTFHNLLNPPETSDGRDPDENCDAYMFARYLKYLLYWKKPEYSRFLTHPAATIRNLELLQNQSFRSSVQHPDLAARLAEGFSGAQIYEPPQQSEQDENTEGEPGPAETAPMNGTEATAAATAIPPGTVYGTCVSMTKIEVIEDEKKTAWQKKRKYASPAEFIDFVNWIHERRRGLTAS